MFMGVLEMLRSAVIVRLGRWLNARLAPVFLASSVRARIQGDESGPQPLRDLGALQSFVGGSGLTFLFDTSMVPLFVALVWLLHPYLGMLALGAAALLFSLSLLNDLLTRKALLEGNVAQIRANVQAETAIRNAEVVQAMGMLPTMVKRWQGVHERSLAGSRAAAERSGMIVGVTKAMRFAVQITVLGLGALLVLKGQLTAGSMIACSILTGRALAPVEQAVGAWKVFVGARIAYSRLKLRLMMMPPEADRTRLPAPLGQLSIERASFVASSGGRPILNQVSFTVEPGEVLAIVGPSAAGKSTLCRLMVGLLHPTSGKVRLDGADLDHWNRDQLGRYIGYLPQDVELFSGTVGENITRMEKGKDKDVIEAAKLAHAHDMIIRLSEGYDTQIGDGGAKLSGGQRQRIGLARAVYGNPRLIILDEPNANLDQVGEGALAGAVNELKQRGAAMVIIGHRPSTLAHADKVLLLKNGRVELYGPRDQVLQRLRKAAVTNAAQGQKSGSQEAQGQTSQGQAAAKGQPAAGAPALKPAPSLIEKAAARLRAESPAMAGQSSGATGAPVAASAVQE
jgi:ATP-binding cassette subfamily C protein/ATP-binding cassette subfamily C exporter for protease/lipase/ATP-binding cassette subfamily C protein EexD